MTVASQLIMSPAQYCLSGSVRSGSPVSVDVYSIQSNKSGTLNGWVGSVQRPSFQLFAQTSTMTCSDNLLACFELHFSLRG